MQFVSKDSPAAAAGIRFGDQILKVNDKEVVGMEGDKVWLYNTFKQNNFVVCFENEEKCEILLSYFWFWKRNFLLNNSYFTGVGSYD